MSEQTDDNRNDQDDERDDDHDNDDGGELYSDVEVDKLPPAEQARALERAQAAKAEGNDKYQRKEYDEAIDCYSKALDLTLPTDFKGASRSYRGPRACASPSFGVCPRRDCEKRCCGARQNNSAPLLAVVVVVAAAAVAVLCVSCVYVCVVCSASCVVCGARRRTTDAHASFSRALSCVRAEERAVYFCNRAACNVALQRHEAVVEDCTQALRLNANYVKVRVRAAACCVF